MTEGQPIGSAPVSTYRLQVREAFDLDAAASVAPYLRDLGVDWAYLSPILQASAGSDHGYDVVDPTRVDASRGGPEGLARFSAAARAAGLGTLVDIVPNHQGVAAHEGLDLVQLPAFAAQAQAGPALGVDGDVVRAAQLDGAEGRDAALFGDRPGWCIGLAALDR